MSFVGTCSSSAGVKVPVSVNSYPHRSLCGLTLSATANEWVAVVKWFTTAKWWLRQFTIAYDGLLTSIYFSIAGGWYKLCSADVRWKCEGKI